MNDIHLQFPTDPAWAPMVLGDFNTFLVDHSTCERKAAATALNFVVQYPDRTELIEPMIVMAREEMLHFHQVSKLMLERGLKFKGDEKSPYVGLMMKNCRTGREERFLDRLLIFGITEARGHERFGLIAEALEEEPLKSFYEKLTDAEERHKDLFVESALKYFSEGLVQSRLEELLRLEAQIMKELPTRVAVH